jgi:hypothetical protein
MGSKMFLIWSQPGVFPAKTPRHSVDTTTARISLVPSKWFAPTICLARLRASESLQLLSSSPRKRHIMNFKSMTNVREHVISVVTIRRRQTMSYEFESMTSRSGVCFRRNGGGRCRAISDLFSQRKLLLVPRFSLSGSAVHLPDYLNIFSRVYMHKLSLELEADQGM